MLEKNGAKRECDNENVSFVRFVQMGFSWYKTYLLKSKVTVYTELLT